MRTAQQSPLRALPPGWTPGGKLRINRGGVKAAERLDGKFVVHTNDDTLSADDMALGYRQLQRVEQAWRQMKSGLGLRPIYHRAERRIRAHVALTVLALLLERMAEHMVGDTWRNIRHDLAGIKLVKLSGPNGTIWQVTEPRTDAAKRLKGTRDRTSATYSPGGLNPPKSLVTWVFCRCLRNYLAYSQLPKSMYPSVSNSGRADRRARREDRQTRPEDPQEREGARRDGAADDNSGHRAHHRAGALGVCAADGELPARSRLLGLARSGSTATHDRRQAETGKDIEEGQRDLRRLLITEAMAVVHHESRRGEASDPWLAGMLERKPKKVVAVALANRMARRVWVLATRKETYRVRAAA